MNASNVIAICAIFIAIISLAVSIVEASVSRRHNRQSVRPILQIVRTRKHGDSKVGLRIENVGLGPAVITTTKVTLDGNFLGPWDRDAFEKVVGSNSPRPRVGVFYPGHVVSVGQSLDLLMLDDSRVASQEWFWNLIAYRISIEFEYESIYGERKYKAIKGPRNNSLPDSQGGQ